MYIITLRLMKKMVKMTVCLASNWNKNYLEKYCLKHFLRQLFSLKRAAWAIILFESLSFWSDSHYFIVPDNLDGDVLIAPGSVPSSDDIGEHTLAGVSVDRVPVIHGLSDTNSVITLRIVPVVGQTWVLR